MDTVHTRPKQSPETSEQKENEVPVGSVTFGDRLHGRAVLVQVQPAQETAAEYDPHLGIAEHPIQIRQTSMEIASTCLKKRDHNADI